MTITIKLSTGKTIELTMEEYSEIKEVFTQTIEYVPNYPTYPNWPMVAYSPATCEV